MFTSPVLTVVIVTPLTVTLPFAGIVVGELKLCAYPIAEHKTSRKIIYRFKFIIYFLLRN